MTIFGDRHPITLCTGAILLYTVYYYYSYIPARMDLKIKNSDESRVDVRGYRGHSRRKPHAAEQQEEEEEEEEGQGEEGARREAAGATA